MICPPARLNDRNREKLPVLRINMETLNEQSSNELIEWVCADLQAGRMEELHDAMQEVHPAEIADLLESLPPEQRSALWDVVAAEQEGEILTNMHEEARATIIDEMEHSELVAAAESMDVEDLAEVLEELPVDLTESILIALDLDHRARLEAVLRHEEGTAGRLMTTEVASIRKDVTLAVVLRWLRRHRQLPHNTDALMVIDEVIDIIREEGDHVLMKRAGLDEEEDLFAPVVPSARRRGIWLGINLVTVFLAAWVIGRFEEALDKIVALAVLMPVVASMGGIAGSQTLTLTIRGMALDQIAKSNIHWLIGKELLVGALNGLVWALVVAVVSYLWFLDPGLAGIIAVATLLNLLAAALSGVTIPLVLRALGIDPALSGAVILTTVTDVIGFLSFLGLATLFLI
jgi:magnesium transporter